MDNYFSFTTYLQDEKKKRSEFFLSFVSILNISFDVSPFFVNNFLKIRLNSRNLSTSNFPYQIRKFTNTLFHCVYLFANSNYTVSH